MKLNYVIVTSTVDTFCIIIPKNYFKEKFYYFSNRLVLCNMKTSKSDDIYLIYLMVCGMRKLRKIRLTVDNNAPSLALLKAGEQILISLTSLQCNFLKYNLCVQICPNITKSNLKNFTIYV